MIYKYERNGDTAQPVKLRDAPTGAHERVSFGICGVFIRRQSCLRLQSKSYEQFRAEHRSVVQTSCVGNNRSIVFERISFV